MKAKHRRHTKENPTAIDHVDNAVGHFVNEHPWISAMIGATALGAAGYVGVLITQAIVRQTPASSSITTSSSDTTTSPSTSSSSTSAPSTSTSSSSSSSSTPTYDANKAVTMYIQNAGKNVVVGDSIQLLDASTGAAVPADFETQGILVAGPKPGSYVAIAPGTVKLYAPDGSSTTVVVKTGLAGVGKAPAKKLRSPMLFPFRALLEA